MKPLKPLFLQHVFPILLKRQDGGALIMALMIMSILSIIGIGATNVAVTELQITGNIEVSNIALYDADSGIQFALAFLQNDLRIGNTPLPDENNPLVAFSAATPTGFSFEISDVEFISENNYFLVSTGQSQNAFRVAVTDIEATFRQRDSQGFQFAGFGDRQAEIKNGGVTKSYNSQSSDPTINDPNSPFFQGTGEADVGSNELLELKNNAVIGGSGIIGQAEDGTQGTINDLGAIFEPAPGNDDTQETERVDPDPLGINSGGKYDPTTYQAGNNHNLTNAYTLDNAGNEVLVNPGTTINLGNKDTLILKGSPGGETNFYFTSVELGNGAEIKIDITNGPVNIFINGGELEAKNGSKITVYETSVDPTTGTVIETLSRNALDFAIYSNHVSENPSAGIQLKNSSEFTGTIYAPHTTVALDNGGDVYGSIWGRRAYVRNSGLLSYDAALKDKYHMLWNDLSITSWAEQRFINL